MSFVYLLVSEAPLKVLALCKANMHVTWAANFPSLMSLDWPVASRVEEEASLKGTKTVSTHVRESNGRDLNLVALMQLDVPITRQLQGAFMMVCLLVRSADSPRPGSVHLELLVD